jgi:glycosyltransferase involved in cell wall biosynthesis
MRVLQLIDSLDAGGAERMAVSIANMLSETIERSYLCTTRQEGLLKSTLKPEVSYLFLNKQGKIDIVAIMALKRYIKKEQINIIHAHSTSFFMATLMKWLRPGLKIVWHDHYGNSNYLQERNYGVLKFCSGYFSLILSVNSVLECWAKHYLKCPLVIFLPNFPVQFRDTLPVTHLKGQLGKRVLCLANMRPQKDHHTLINAFRKVHNDYPEWTLHCVGQDFKDNYSKSIYALVNDLNLKNQIYFYGSCPDTDYVIQQSDIGVLSSASEGLPLALLEYGLGSLPVVATDVGDCRSALPKACYYFLVAAAEPQLMADRLKVLMGEADQRDRLSDLMFQHVTVHFSAVAVTNKLKVLYSQL